MEIKYPSAANVRKISTVAASSNSDSITWRMADVAGGSGVGISPANVVSRRGGFVTVKTTVPILPVFPIVMESRLVRIFWGGGQLVADGLWLMAC